MQMQYDMNVTIKIKFSIHSLSELIPYDLADSYMETLIADNPVLQGITEIDYDYLSDESNEEVSFFTGEYKLQLTVDVRYVGDAMETARQEVESFIRPTLLNNEEKEIHIVFSDTQTTLNRLLDSIHPNEIVAVDFDGERYHYMCAIQLIGEHAVWYSKERVSMIKGDEWKKEVRKAYYHNEDIYDTCSKCLGTIYNKKLKKETP